MQISKSDSVALVRSDDVLAKMSYSYKWLFILVNTQTSETVNKYRKTATTVGTCGSNDRWGYWKNIDSSSSEFAMR